MRFIEKNQIEVGVLPKDITGAAQTGTYISLKGYDHVTILIVQGTWAGGTPAVTLHQATAVAGTGEKALAFDKKFDRISDAATTWNETAVVSNTFNLPAATKTVHAIEIDAADLDVTNGFDCLTVKTATPGANADLLTIIYILSGARHPQAAILNAKAD
jgi:hypothetical protein